MLEDGFFLSPISAANDYRKYTLFLEETAIMLAIMTNRKLSQ
jgi:hypothetical protein